MASPYVNADGLGADPKLTSSTGPLAGSSSIPTIPSNPLGGGPAVNQQQHQKYQLRRHQAIAHPAVDAPRHNLSPESSSPEASASQMNHQGTTSTSTPAASLIEGHYRSLSDDQQLILDPNQPSARLEDMSHRPTSLHEFFRDFWIELQELVQELAFYGKNKTWKKKIMAVLLLVSSVLVFSDLLFGDFIYTHLEHFIHWMASHAATAVLAFVGIFVLSTLVFIPPALLIFGAGYAFAQALGLGWGILAAVLSCLIGSCIGALLAFLRSRYMMRDMIYLFSKRYPLVRAADRALKRNGFHIMLLLRLCPLIPFNGLNYCCGITGVSLEDFTMSLIGIIPFQVFTIVVGATTGTFALEARTENYNSRQEIGFIILIALGVASGLLALVHTWRVVKKELRKELELTPEQFDTYLHPDETEQGGMEPSIEIRHMASRNETGDLQREQCYNDDEEWFWVWT